MWRTGVLMGLAFVAGLVVAGVWMRPPVPQCPPCPGWPLWEAYADRFIQDDGRVIEIEADGRSTSEGQAYALFFALVADDRKRFERVLAWTEDNLARGDLTARLPAWLWGQRDDGSWGVLDSNAASDADLWLAYSLLQAGRLWNEPRFTSIGALVLEHIRRGEVTQLPGVGLVVLPGPKGFRPEENLWRLNPSYWPLPVLRAFALHEVDGPWDVIAANAVSLIAGGAVNGLAPDWLIYRGAQGVQPDTASGGLGGFEAIRVYLWAGMTTPEDPLARSLLEAVDGMGAYLADHPVPPRTIDPALLQGDGDAPPGFSGALLPYLAALGERETLERQRQRLAAHRRSGGLYGEPPRYYDQNLIMFGQGWLEGRFRFDSHGQLMPSWIRS